MFAFRNPANRDGFNYSGGRRKRGSMSAVMIHPRLKWGRSAKGARGMLIISKGERRDGVGVEVYCGGLLMICLDKLVLALQVEILGLG